MATDKIEILIEAKVKQALKNMGLVEGKGKTLGKKSEGLFKQLRLGWIAVAGAVLGVAKAIGGAISAAAEFEEANAKFGTVFRGVSREANAMRKELVESYGLSTTEATRFLASTQDLFVPLGVARDKAAELSGEVVTLARDVASFNKLPTGTVLRDIQSAMVGNFETTRKYGVVLSETTVKQRAMEKGIKITSGRISAQDRALVALELITEGSSDAMGDFKRTSDSFSNTLVSIKARAEDVNVAIGQQFIEAIQPSAKEMNDFLKTQEGLSTISLLVKTVASLVVVMKNAFSNAFKTIKSAIAIVTTPWKTLVESIRLAIAKDWKGAFDALKGGIAETGTAVKDTLIGGWVNVGKTWKDIAGVFTETKDGIIEGTNEIVVGTEEANVELKKLNEDLATFIATSDAGKQARKISDLEDLLRRTQAAQVDEITGENDKATAIKLIDEALTKEKKKQLDQQKRDWEVTHEAQKVIAETFVDAALSGIESWKSTSKDVFASIIKAFTDLISGKLALQAAAWFVNPATFPLAVAATVAAGTVKALGGTAAAKITSAAGGADFVTNGPQMMMVGDNPSGRERVTVQPLDQSDRSTNKEYHFHGITNLSEARNELLRLEGEDAF